jgi:[protein-PII] uridylyltransferase
MSYLDRARDVMRRLGRQVPAEPAAAPSTADASTSWIPELQRSLPISGEVLAAIGSIADANALAPLQALQAVLAESGVSGERFGSMARELNAPDLLVLALGLHDPQTAAPVLDRLHLTPAERQTVEFLIRNRSQMAQVAFRRDIADPDVVARFTELFSTEEQLKMLCLMTVADQRAASRDGLTPWKAELLWRLFVDSYTHLTMAYGDEMIDKNGAALTALQAGRPDDISEAELGQFLEGLPRRYLTLFDPDSIYNHVRLRRDLGPENIRFSSAKRGDVWELTVVASDRPYLFSNISGVLAYLEMDILRGYALTSLNGIALDVFQFHDASGALEASKVDPLFSDVMAGRVDITLRLHERERDRAGRTPGQAPPVLYFDNDVSQRYTVLELIADDAPRLLHRISRVISSSGCVVDLVLISTEGRRAIDVFHLRKDNGKLSDSDQLALTQDLERMLEEI